MFFTTFYMDHKSLQSSTSNDFSYIDFWIYRSDPEMGYFILFYKFNTCPGTGIGYATTSSEKIH
jgi:hypothetical protein